MVNLLEPNIRPIEEYVPDKFDFHILVDTVPSNAGIGKNTIKFDVVIDHHRDKEFGNSDFDGVYIDLKAGSCCATMFELMNKKSLHFEEDNVRDSQIATAMLIGISTDTENLISDDTTEYEFNAWAKLFGFRNNDFKKVIRYERPISWIYCKADAVKQAEIHDGVGVVGIGNIDGTNRDMISDLADEVVTWQGVETAVVYAVVDGRQMEGSVRSRASAINVPNICKQLAQVCEDSPNQNGGGKPRKGAYRYDLGGGGVLLFSDSEDPENSQKMWDLLRKKETSRIFKLIVKG